MSGEILTLGSSDTNHLFQRWMKRYGSPYQVESFTTSETLREHVLVNPDPLRIVVFTPYDRHPLQYLQERLQEDEALRDVSRRNIHFVVYSDAKHLMKHTVPRFLLGLNQNHFNEHRVKPVWDIYEATPPDEEDVGAALLRQNSPKVGKEYQIFLIGTDPKVLQAYHDALVADDPRCKPIHFPTIEAALDDVQSHKTKAAYGIIFDDREMNAENINQILSDPRVVQLANEAEAYMIPQSNAADGADVFIEELHFNPMLTRMTRLALPVPEGEAAAWRDAFAREVYMGGGWAEMWKRKPEGPALGRG